MASARSPLTCPACGHTLTLRESGGLRVDACVDGCGGVWFDNFELARVDEPGEGAGQAFTEIPRDPAAAIDPTARRRCPVCADIVLRRHFFSARRNIEVDECAQCAGTWLDAGELGRIRAEYPSAERREEAAEAHFSERFDAELARMRAESAEQAQRAGRFAHMFRWICPSRYMPGKQEGAAF